MTTTDNTDPIALALALERAKLAAEDVRNRLGATLYARRLVRVPIVRQKRTAEACILVEIYRRSREQVRNLRRALAALGFEPERPYA